MFPTHTLQFIQSKWTLCGPVLLTKCLHSCTYSEDCNYHNVHQKVRCYENIGLYVHNVLINLCWMISIIKRLYVSTKCEKHIFSLTCKICRLSTIFAFITTYSIRGVLQRSSFLGNLKPSDNILTYGELQLHIFLLFSLYLFFSFPHFVRHTNRCLK